MYSLYNVHVIFTLQTFKRDRWCYYKVLNVTTVLKFFVLYAMLNAIEICKGNLLAHLPMSLCNHELSIHVVSCGIVMALVLSSVDSPPSSHGLITESSYLAHTCTYAPSICTRISKYNMYFLNGSHFSLFLYLALLTTWLNLEPSYLAQLCPYTGTTHTHTHKN